MSRSQNRDRAPDLFDLAEGERRRDEALDQLDASHHGVLSALRQYLARRYQLQRERVGGAAYVSADDAWLWLEEQQLVGRISSAALGAVFRTEDWVPTGQWVQSTRPSNHARRSMCWRLRR